MVELDGDITGNFEVLLLVLTHWNNMGAIEQDIGGHQHRIGEQTVIDSTGVTIGQLCDFVFVTMAPLQKAHGRHGGEQPRQFGVFRGIGLLPKDTTCRVQTAGHKIESHIQGILPTQLGVRQ